MRKEATLKQTLACEEKEGTGLVIIQSKLVYVYLRVFSQRHDITIAYICKSKPNKITLQRTLRIQILQKTPNKYSPIFD